MFTPVPAPKSKGQWQHNLFVQFRGHMYAVTRECLSNFVRGRARFLSLSGDFRFCAIQRGGGSGDSLCSERTE
ncbi:hypothetical protein DR74_4835 [Enterobacter cloacae]|nr:hypothetical protein DR74_4835 [Enterobacter cloacae]